MQRSWRRPKNRYHQQNHFLVSATIGSSSLSVDTKKSKTIDKPPTKIIKLKTDLRPKETIKHPTASKMTSSIQRTRQLAKPSPTAAVEAPELRRSSRIRYKPSRFKSFISSLLTIGNSEGDGLNHDYSLLNSPLTAPP